MLLHETVSTMKGFGVANVNARSTSLTFSVSFGFDVFTHFWQITQMSDTNEKGAIGSKKHYQNTTYRQGLPITPHLLKMLKTNHLEHTQSNPLPKFRSLSFFWLIIMWLYVCMISSHKIWFYWFFDAPASVYN